MQSVKLQDESVDFGSKFLPRVQSNRVVLSSPIDLVNTEIRQKFLLDVFCLRIKQIRKLQNVLISPKCENG